MSVQHDPRLTAYALGELSSKEARELEPLLERDAGARLEVAAIRQAASWLESELAGSLPPALSARRRASILAAAARGKAPVETPASPGPRRFSWVLLAALALPAAAAVVVVQHRHAVSDGLPPAARAHGTVDVAAERTSDVRRPQPPSAAPSADAPMASDPMPESGTLPDPDEDLAAPASGARTSERMARPSAPDEPSRTIGSVGALARGGDDEGEADDIGSEGGVVGGVVGGLVGERLVPPAPSEAGPKQLTARAGQSLLAIDPNVSPYKVDLPEEYVQRGEEYHATISICVAADGSVSSVEILKPSIPIIDRQIPKVVPLWKYHPYLVDGKPTPFCYGTNYRVVRGP